MFRRIGDGGNRTLSLVVCTWRLRDSPTERIITLRITSERITSESINTEHITSERIKLPNVLTSERIKLPNV